jgi:hypothetical protein
MNGETYAQQVLMDAFDFTAADLAANRTGTISPQQKEQLKPRISWLMGLIIVLALGFGSIVWGAFGIHEPGHDANFFYGLGVIILVLGPVVVFIDRRGTRNIQKGRIQVIRGPVSLKTVRVMDNVEYCATIERKTFTVTDKQYQVLKDGQFYCFYYVTGGYPRGKRILSVEPFSSRSGWGQPA